MTSLHITNIVRFAIGLALFAITLAEASQQARGSTAPATLEAPPGWRRMGETALATLYVQTGSLQREGQIRRVIEMQSLKEKDADGVLSRRYTAEYECRHQMFRIGRVSSHAGPLLSGAQVFDVQEMGYWRKIVPGTPFALLFSMVCADYDGPQG